MSEIADIATRRVLLHIVDKVWPADHHPERCGRCGHSILEHRLDDSLNLSPTDPTAPFRCVRGVEQVVSFLCDCPDWIEPEESNQGGPDQ